MHLNIKADTRKETSHMENCFYTPKILMKSTIHSFHTRFMVFYFMVTIDISISQGQLDSRVWLGLLNRDSQKIVHS